MNNFYVLRNSTDEAQIGHYPQVIPHTGYNPHQPQGHLQVQPLSFPSFDPIYEMTIHPSARPTDLIDKGTLTFGLVVSGKLRELFESMSLPEHRFYSIGLHYRGEKLQYYWFHYRFDLWDHIVITESSYRIFKRASGETIAVECPSSKEQFQALLSEKFIDRAIRWEKITLKQSPEHLDILEYGALVNNTVISSKLREAMVTHGITGCEYHPINALAYQLD